LLSPWNNKFRVKRAIKEKKKEKKSIAGMADMVGLAKPFFPSSPGCVFLLCP
jgi:hypothetical protein